VDFNDGSIVRLSENTLLTVEDLRVVDGGPFSRFQMELGKIWVSLFGGTFELQTPVGLATVRGSYATFEVIFAQPDDPGSLTLVMDCLEGACTAKNENVTTNLGNLERVVLTKGAREISRTAAPLDALPDFLAHNPNPESQRILPTLTAAPALTRTREPLPPATPFRTMSPRPRVVETPTAPPPTRTLEPRPTSTPETRPTLAVTRPVEIRLTATPEPRTPILRPTDPLIPRPTDSPVNIRPTDPIIPRPTDPIIVRPTDPVIPRPTGPILPRPTDPIIPRPTDPILPRPTDPINLRLTDSPFNILPTRTPLW
jgi:hypothetical protein